jgi:hypothetical protein
MVYESLKITFSMSTFGGKFTQFIDVDQLGKDQ